MTTFSEVEIKRGADGLVRSTGFWSGKEVLMNTSPTPTIYLLNKKATTADLIQSIQSFIDANLRDWIISEFQRAFPNKNFGIPFYSLRDIPSLPERVFHGNVEILVRQGKTEEEAFEFLADAWIAQWGEETNAEGMNGIRGVPAETPLAALLLVPWRKLDSSVSAEVFLQGLSDLVELDMSITRFFEKWPHPHILFSCIENAQHALSSLDEKEKSLLSRYGADNFTVELTTAKMRVLLRLDGTASHALSLLVRDGHILVSSYLPGDLQQSCHNLGMFEPFSDTFNNLEKTKSRKIRVAFARLITSSTIRTPVDVPQDLRKHWPSTRSFSFWLPLLKLLPAYGKEHGLPTFDVSSFQKGAAIKKTSLQWTEAWLKSNGYSPEWCEFAGQAYQACTKTEKSVRNTVGLFVTWGAAHFQSPWDITPISLRDPHNPRDPNTFHAYCKSSKRESHSLWSVSATMFKAVTTYLSIPGYPGYREGIVSPFAKIKNPFKAPGRNAKTHRSRIATVIHEKMIEVLCDFDEDGKPTFEWAKETTRKYFAEEVRPGGWCPTRFTALAILLLLPPRKKQVRWLDQGLMDEMVFDPETFEMVENTHRLRNYRYADGETHLERYGRPTGVIQQLTEPFMGASEHLSIFVNTNKTQLWNPTKRNGYEVPWPDGSELIASDDEAVQEQGRWLSRVYEVLAYQYRYVLRHDPDPTPITFTDLPEDVGDVPSDEDIWAVMPNFVPLFRNTTTPIQVVRGDKLLMASPPISSNKLESTFVALCMEVEERLKDEGYEHISLTRQNTTKGAPKTGVTSRRLKFDIHSLRVAGISRLIEMGIDPSIVQEFIAGHLTPAMTHRYLMMQPWHVREKIIEATANGDFKNAMDAFREKVAKGEWDEKTAPFVSAPRLREYSQDLPNDYASFTPVDGGVCIMGGKGDPCNEGGVYEQISEKKNEVEIRFGPVRGGCGNCMYFRTAPFLIQEQSLILDSLMSDLRALARQRKELKTEASNINCQVDSCKVEKDKHKLIDDHNLYKARLESLNHNMVPVITEWYNRYLMLMECQAQMDSFVDDDEVSTDLIMAPFGASVGLSMADLKVEMEECTDTSLLGRIIEKSRTLEGRGIPIPENQARMLEQSVDKLLRMQGSPSLLLDIKASDRARAASMLHNAMEDKVGAAEIQKALDGGLPLSLSEEERGQVNKFAGAIVEASNSGKLSLSGISEVATGCNLITASEERGIK